MFRVAVKTILARKWRLLLTTVAVAISVAFVSGTMVLSDTLNGTFDKIFASTYSNVDTTVWGKSATDSSMGTTQERPDVPPEVLEAVAAVDGVADVRPIRDGFATMIDPATGDAVVNGQSPTIGVSWIGNDVDAVEFSAGGPPEGPDDIVIDRASANRLGVEIGDSVPVVTVTGRDDFRVAGVVTLSGNDSIAGATLVYFHPDVAGELLGMPDDYAELALIAEPGVSDEQLRDRVAQVLPANMEALTGEEAAEAEAGALQEALSFLTIGLLVFAGVALFVATFIIVNTFTMLVAQRARELALLRAVGAARGQVTRMVLAEAVVIGLVAGVVGLAVGIGLGALLQWLMAVGLDFPTSSLVISPGVVVWSFVIAIVVTVVAALLPAVRASRVPPVAALRDDVSIPQRSIRMRVLGGAVLAVVGALAMVGGFAGGGGALVGLGVGLTFIGVALLAPALARPVVRVVGWPFRSTVGHLARQNAVRNPRRTAATASALMIGLALVSTVAVFASSTVATIDRVIDRSLGADLVVMSQTQVPFTPALAEAVRGVDGVETVAQVRWGNAAVGDGGAVVQLFGISADGAQEALSLDMAAGDADAALARGELLVDVPTSESKGWSVGDTVPVTFQAGSGEPLQMRVGGVYERNQFAGTSFVSLETLSDNGGMQQDFMLTMQLGGDADPAAVRQEVDAIADELAPTVQVSDQTEFKEQARSQVQVMMGIIYALLALAVIIASLGIVNTLALSVIERTREIGLLRAVGTTRRQLRRAIRVEAVIVSLFGAVLGVTLGTVFGIALVKALESQGFDQLAIPWVYMGVFFVVAALIGVLAAIAPARRAAKMDVLRAIATT